MSNKCASNKIRNPATGRCVLRSGKIGKEILTKKRSLKRSVKKRSPKKRSVKKKSCGSGKIRNPATGRCVSRSGKIGKSLLIKKSPKKSRSPKRSVNKRIGGKFMGMTKTQWKIPNMTTKEHAKKYIKKQAIDNLLAEDDPEYVMNDTIYDNVQFYLDSVYNYYPNIGDKISEKDFHSIAKQIMNHFNI